MEDLILKMLKKHDLELPRYQKLDRYYKGEHDYVLAKKQAKTTDENHKVPVAWPNKIVSVKLGYFLGGDAISYSSKIEGDELLTEIDRGFTGWEEKHTALLHQYCSVFGRAYELQTLVDGEYECFAFSPLEMVCLLDGSKKKNVKLAIRRYQKEFDDTEYLEVITDNEIVTYSLTENQLAEIDRKKHIFTKCPVLLYENNSEQMGDFELVLPLINEYDYVTSRNIDELAMLADAYFILEGAEGTKEEELKKMSSNRIILTKQGNKAYFATKDLVGEFREKVLERLEKEIIQQSNITILSTVELSSNVSGVALRTKLQELENVVSMNEINLKELIYRRLKFFTEYLKIRKNKEFDYKQIIIEFSRNLPSNLKELSDIVQILKGSVSLQTLISQLPFVKDVNLELNRLNKEAGQDLTAEEIKKMIAEHLPKEE